MTADPLYAGLDLGTSSLKGVVLDAEGRAVAEVRRAYETARPGAGRAEQDPLDWTAAARSALAALVAATPAADWAGIGLSGMIPTLVTVDADLRPVGPAFTWEDCRAHVEAEEIAAQVGEIDLYQRTGQPMDGRYLLPMYAWIHRYDRERAARTMLVLSAKDYLFSWLTGQLATDPSTASGYGGYDLVRGKWMGDVAALAGVAASGGGAARPGLPPVVPSTATWPLEQRLALDLGLPEGLPVCAGAADSVLAAQALDAVTPGAVAYVWGTSTVILGAGDELTVDPERRCLITPLAAGGWGTEMDLVSTGAAVAWLSRMLGFGDDGQARVFAVAAGAADGLVPAALPFVGVGEQGALWDNDVRGTFMGLDLSHGPGDLARAMLDGIVLESRRCLARLHELGLPQGDVCVAWRGADPWFCQRLADASGRTVIVGDPATSSSAAGAARLAAIAVGAGLPAAAAAGSRRSTPDRAAGRTWDRRWREYERLLTPLRKVYRTWPGKREA
ncbi:MAG TPA: FGGY-family carbohydrate kinase [Thermoleophilia bacterium]|nr:FGGY-family carbohydrate kinase [Thermoleophilia bacterium]